MLLNDDGCRGAGTAYSTLVELRLDERSCGVRRGRDTPCALELDLDRSLLP